MSNWCLMVQLILKVNHRFLNFKWFCLVTINFACQLLFSVKNVQKQSYICFRQASYMLCELISNPYLIFLPGSNISLFLTVKVVSVIILMWNTFLFAENLGVFERFNGRSLSGLIFFFFGSIRVQPLPLK